MDADVFDGELNPENRYKYAFHESELEQIKALVTGPEDNDTINSDEEYCDNGEDILIDFNYGPEGDSEDDDTDPEIDDDDENMNPNQEEWLSRPETEARVALDRADTTHFPPGVNTAYDYFNLLFTEELLQDMVLATNKCAADALFDCSISGMWKEVDIAEFRIFLGLLFMMGTVRSPNVMDYFRNDDWFPKFAIKCMPRNRFLAIFRFLKFGKENLNTLINHFNNTMDALFTPGTDLLIDESLILRRGRDEIQQVINGKRHKYGVELCTLVTPCAVTIQMHMGQGRRDEEADDQKRGDKVIKNLMSKFLNAEHHLFLPDYYNSVSLAEFLLKNKTFVTGPLRRHREGNPKVVCKSKLSKGESIFRYTRSGVCVCKWRGSHKTLMISSTWSPELVPVVNKGRKIVRKPDMIAKFDEFLERVVDNEMFSFYAFEIKGMRWYKKVGIHIIQIMFVNAYYLYKIHNNLNLDYYEFRSRLMKSLLPMLYMRASKRKTKSRKQESAVPLED